MLFEFELEGLENEINGAILTEEDGLEEETYLDEHYFSWASHDLLMLDHRSDYLYPFQESYTPEKHPGSFGVDDIWETTEGIRTSFGIAEIN